jgi:hypothetical protein
MPTPTPYYLRPKATKLPAGHDDTLDPAEAPVDAEERSVAPSEWPVTNTAPGGAEAPEGPLGPPATHPARRSLPPFSWPAPGGPTPRNRPLAETCSPIGDLDPDIAMWPVTLVQRWPFAGAPTVGIWPKGWLGVDNTATIYVCTVGGQPGTWTPISTTTGSSLSAPPLSFFLDPVGQVFHFQNAGVDVVTVDGVGNLDPSGNLILPSTRSVSWTGGLSLLQGAGIPSPALGNNGSFYLQNDAVPPASGFYQKQGGRWVLVGGTAIPAPVSSGATIVSFTDVNGDIWVAKNGVNGGAYRRARDVLVSVLFRSAAFSTTTTALALGFDTVLTDDYGIGTGSPTVWTAPVAGFYKVKSNLAAFSSAVGESLSVAVQKGAQILTNNQTQSGNATDRFDADVEMLTKCAAGDQLRVLISSSATLSGIPAGLGAAPTIATVQYEGTG